MPITHGEKSEFLNLSHAKIDFEIKLTVKTKLLITLIIEEREEEK